MAKKNRIPRLILRAYPNVKSVKDANHSVSIQVLAKDCKNAEPLNPNECALAHAVKRQFKADAAIIGLGASYIIKGGKATRFHTPERIRREIVSFDRHSDFAEGNYILTQKSKSNRLGNYKDKPAYRDQRARHDKHKPKHVKSPRVRVLNSKNA